LLRSRIRPPTSANFSPSNRTVWVNCHNMVDPNMPFGGFKQSGFGREHGRVAVEMCTEMKSVCMAI
jgi:acyl-CoA reductase-like NAD-dependent aldehyde dehydrogenase